MHYKRRSGLVDLIKNLHILMSQTLSKSAPPPYHHRTKHGFLLYLQEMICVEAALATSGPVKLAPGKSWTGTQVLTSSKL